MSDLEREPDPWQEQATERWERLEDRERAEEAWRDRLTRDVGESGGRKRFKAIRETVERALTPEEPKP